VSNADETQPIEVTDTFPAGSRHRTARAAPAELLRIHRADRRLHVQQHDQQRHQCP